MWDEWLALETRVFDHWLGVPRARAAEPIWRPWRGSRQRPLAAAVVLDVSRRLLRGARLHCFPRRRRRGGFRFYCLPLLRTPSLCGLSPRRHPFLRFLSRCPFLSGRGGGEHNDEAVWPRACANGAAAERPSPHSLPFLRLQQQSPRCVHSSPCRRRRWRWSVTLRERSPRYGGSSGWRMRWPPCFPLLPTRLSHVLSEAPGPTSAFRRNGIIDRRGDFAAPQRPARA